MKHSTRALGLFIFIVGFLLVRPTSATAQAVEPADLVGTWEGVPGEDPVLLQDKRLTKHTLIIRADSTWQEIRAFNAAARQKLGGTWRLSGDTIFWGGSEHKVVLQEQKLSLLKRDSNTPMEVYSRVDSLKQP